MEYATGEEVLRGDMVRRAEDPIGSEGRVIAVCTFSDEGTARMGVLVWFPGNRWVMFGTHEGALGERQGVRLISRESAS